MICCCTQNLTLQEGEGGMNWESSVDMCALCVCVCMCALSHFSHGPLFVTPWTVACQAPLSRGVSRREYWSGLLCPPPGALPNPGVEPTCLTSPALARGFFTTSATWEAHVYPAKCKINSYWEAAMKHRESSASMVLWWPRMVRGCGGGGTRGRDACTLRAGLCYSWQRPTQHCQAISSNLNNNNKKRI